MLISDLRLIGNRLLDFRKKRGLTQAEVAERADLSDRTYADIERGHVNMRIETFIKICTSLHVTPDEILVRTDSPDEKPNDLNEMLKNCSEHDRKTAMKILEAFLSSQ